MGACYGDGILGSIPGDIEGEAAKVAFLQKFAALGLSNRFREIIGNRVIELSYKNGQVTTTWLSDADAALVVAAAKSVGGSAPYSMFPGALDVQLHIPGCRGNYSGSLKMPGESIDGWGFSPMRASIAAMEDTIKRIEAGESDYDLDFCKSLLNSLKVCSDNRLLFTIGY